MLGIGQQTAWRSMALIMHLLQQLQLAIILNGEDITKLWANSIKKFMNMPKHLQKDYKESLTLLMEF